jgi:hypothetical protein
MAALQEIERSTNGELAALLSYAADWIGVPAG